MILTVQKPYIRIGKRSEQISIFDGAKIKKIPVRHIESVIIMSKAIISPDALYLLAEHGIPVFYIRKGIPYAAYMPYSYHGTVITRKSQFDAYSNTKGLEFMRSIVIGAMQNKVKLLRYYAHNRRNYDRNNALKLTELADKISALIDDVRGIKAAIGSIVPNPSSSSGFSGKNNSNRVKEYRGPNKSGSTDKKNFSMNDKSSGKDSVGDKVKRPQKGRTKGDDDRVKPDGKEDNGVAGSPGHPGLPMPKTRGRPKSSQSGPSGKVGSPRAKSSIQGARVIKDLQIYRSTLMGYEGAASRFYFMGLKLILPPELGFRKRTRRPPTDPFNAALSFANKLLANEILIAIVSAGLEPYAGFMHGDRSGRASLIYDLMEEFRQPLVDRLIIRLFQRKIISPKDFIVMTQNGPVSFQSISQSSRDGGTDPSPADNPELTGDNGLPEGSSDREGNGTANYTRGVSTLFNKAVRFKDAALKRFLSEFYYFIRKDGEMVKGWFLTHQQIMQKQAAHLVRYFLGKDPAYIPYSPRL